VKRIVLFALAFALLLCVAGCGGGSEKPIVVAKPVEIPPSGVMTLTQEQLLWLDWHSPHRRGARVMAKRPAGTGVEFDINFPSNAPGDTWLNFVSSGEGGQGALVGGDCSGFRAFALKMTLVSIDGRSEPDAKRKLVVGAVIGPTASGRVHTWEPVTLSMAESERTAIARTAMRIDRIRTIGFHVHVLDAVDWDSSGNTVTIRVEPVAEGGAAPWLPPEAPSDQR